MSWLINAKHIGAQLTIERLDHALEEQARLKTEAHEQITAVVSLLRSELRRIQDQNPFSEYLFEVSASGHTSPAATEGSLNGTFTITWRHRLQ